MLFLRLVKESFAFAINALRVNKLRTFLSLLGVSIGIFTIITVFTVVDSLKDNIKGSVEKLGSNVIYVQKWPWTFGPDYPWWKYFMRPNPTIKDFEALQEKDINAAEAMTFQINIDNQVVKYRNSSVENVSVSGASHDYNAVRQLDFEEGRYFSASESRSGKNYAILGNSVAKGLFGEGSAIGKTIKIKGRKMSVIGVFVKEGDDLMGNSWDDGVLLPINYIRNLVDIRSDRFNPMIMVKGKTDANMEELENELQGSLRTIRRVSPRSDDNFALNKSSMLAAPMESMFMVINLAGWVIGGFSILVGGFGIANIMFVSVRERTNIIGIQKSLGAKNYFILLQFLVEAVVLCLIGGAIGLLFVFLITYGVSQAADIDMVLDLGNVIWGLGISAVIGIISGFWPAYSASQLDPVEAIRAK